MPDNDSQITVREVTDFLDEKKILEKGDCTFTVVDRTPIFFVSTKLNDIYELSQLPGWKLELNAGSDKLKRFSVKISKEALKQHLHALYGNERLVWLPN